jgi:hypothetical protein
MNTKTMVAATQAKSFRIASLLFPFSATYHHYAVYRGSRLHALLERGLQSLPSALDGVPQLVSQQPHEALASAKGRRRRVSRFGLEPCAPFLAQQLVYDGWPHRSSARLSAPFGAWMFVRCCLVLRIAPDHESRIERGNPINKFQRPHQTAFAQRDQSLRVHYRPPGWQASVFSTKRQGDLLTFYDAL